MKLTGTYTFERGEFVPQGSMREIVAQIDAMKLVAGQVQMPLFYRDIDGQYWRYNQREDYFTELEAVTRDYIEANHPELDPDNLITLDRQG